MNRFKNLVLLFTSFCLFCSTEPEYTKPLDYMHLEDMVQVEGGSIPPSNKISVSGFRIDSTEVTQADYHSVIGYPLWGSSNDDIGPEYPAMDISWYEALLYCNARSKRDNLDTVYTYDSICIGCGRLGHDTLTNVQIHYNRRGYRLPTVAEYEYVYRAGTSTDFFWEKDYGEYPDTQEDWDEVNSYLVYYGNGINYYGSNPVATKSPNNWGVYDIAGNVAEWCNNWYSNTSYKDTTIFNPIGADIGTIKILKGGSWRTALQYHQAGSIGGEPPSIGGSTMGFRCVLPDSSR